MSSVKKKRRLKKNILIPFIIIIIVVIVLISLPKKNNTIEKEKERYISGNIPMITLYDLEYKESISISRGTLVYINKFKEKKGDDIYIKIKYNDDYYLINQNNLTDNKDDIVKEKELYVRTNLTVYKDSTSSKILSYIKKGEKIEIIGFDRVNENGVVNRYKIKYKNIEGYVYGKYLVNTKEEADKVYDNNGLQEYLAKMGNNLKGGTASELDYYPYEKPKFKDNKMPSEVRALYINSGAVKNIDKYIEFAKNNNINAFVIDIVLAVSDVKA